MSTHTADTAAFVTMAVAFVLNTGCASKRAPEHPTPPPAVTEVRLPQESLFKGDQEILSDRDIDRILATDITLADRRRRAVLALNSRSTWSQELLDLETENSERLLRALAAIPQLTQVRPMPALLVPEKRTVAFLREAAARFQADLLLVYTTRVQTFQQERLIGADVVRAGCTAESVLLDVRTGIIVHAARVSDSLLAKKSGADLDFSQTIAKAQSEATGKALLKMAEDIVTRLKPGGD
jgi:hypothetical protein